MRSLKVVISPLKKGQIAHAAQTRIFNAETDEEIQVLDIKLYIEGGRWMADIKVPVSEFDIHAHLNKKIVRCMYCKREDI